MFVRGTVPKWALRYAFLRQAEHWTVDASILLYTLVHPGLCVCEYQLMCHCIITPQVWNELPNSI